MRSDRERIRKYKLVGEINTSSIVQFVGDFKNKKAQRIYLSESVAGLQEENKKNHVKVMENLAYFIE